MPEGKRRQAAGREIANVLTAMLIPGVNLLLRVEDRELMRLDLARITLLLEAYRIEQGEYPVSLDRLTPKYTKELPGDVYSDAFLIYRRDGERYLLYSVGPNGKDDSGAGDDVFPPAS
jgi:hypothetical protein